MPKYGSSVIHKPFQSRFGVMLADAGERPGSAFQNLGSCPTGLNIDTLLTTFLSSYLSTGLYYFRLHCIALRCATLQYITLYCVTLL